MLSSPLLMPYHRQILDQARFVKTPQDAGTLVRNNGVCGTPVDKPLGEYSRVEERVFEVCPPTPGPLLHGENLFVQCPRLRGRIQSEVLGKAASAL